MKNNILFIIGLAISTYSCNSSAPIGGKATYAGGLTLRDSVFMVAESDLDKDSLKYYYFGIAAAPSRLFNRLREHNILLINNIDIPNQHYAVYNQFADSIILSRTGKTFQELFDEK
ncbi:MULTISPECIES: hypothetical protein [Sphingobacterium]|uniref:hypothetical protein n=1 Tax=Sphingobacterium TaxID=28453 RepID=UPI0013DC3CA8|nr:MULTISPECIES: hypothetical protein [unclassified Sphingobacterium]